MNALTQNLISEYRAIAERTVINYRTDIDHDAECIKRELNPETRGADYLIFQLRKNGTHCLVLHNKNGLPAKNERVKYLFGMATGQEILEQMEIYTDCTGDQDRPHYVLDIAKKSLKKISYKDGVLLVSEQKKRVYRQWDTPLPLPRVA